MKKIVLVIQFSLFLFACHSADKEYVGDTEDSFEELLDIPATQQSQQPQLSEEGVTSGEVTKKTIKTGEVNFQSKHIENDYKKILKLLPKYDGYIESENQTKNDYRINYNLTIRVSSTNYDSLFTSLVGIGSRLDNKSSNIQDVTERYYDLKARVKNKKVLEIRYLELLKKASDVKDILQIENNLNEVRTDIEQLQGQFNYLSKQISLSTIHLSFYEVLPYAYDSPQRKGFGTRILNSLDNGWQGFLSFLVVIISLWPFLILVSIGVYLFMSLRKRLRSGNRKE